MTSMMMMMMQHPIKGWSIAMGMDKRRDATGKRYACSNLCGRTRSLQIQTQPTILSLRGAPAQVFIRPECDDRIRKGNCKALECFILHLHELPPVLRCELPSSHKLLTPPGLSDDELPASVPFARACTRQACEILIKVSLTWREFARFPCFIAWPYV